MPKHATAVAARLRHLLFTCHQKMAAGLHDSGFRGQWRGRGNGGVKGETELF